MYFTGSKDQTTCSRKIKFDVKITETTITTDTGNNKALDVPYRIIGGNSNLYIVEGTDVEGDQIVSSIELIPGGLRMQTMDCIQYPKKCDPEGSMAEHQLREGEPMWLYFVPKKQCNT